MTGISIKKSENESNPPSKNQKMTGIYIKIIICVKYLHKEQGIWNQIFKSIYFTG